MLTECGIDISANQQITPKVKALLEAKSLILWTWVIVGLVGARCRTHKKKPCASKTLSGGIDGTRTRGLLRDRQAL